MKSFNKKLIAGIILAGLILLIFGCTQPNGNGNTFQSVAGSVCMQDGKPIIRLYATSFCPHCKWVAPAYEEVVKKFVDANQIVAYHWEWIYDAQNNPIGSQDLLNPTSGPVPASEEAVFKEFNPAGTIPTFVFGCKYYRVGNQFEEQNDLNAEKNVFTQIINQVIADSKTPA